MKDDVISRQAAVTEIAKFMLEYGGENEKRERDALHRAANGIKALPSAQPERLTDDDFETIRIHLNAQKEKLCNQHRWEEAEEYQRIIDRFMAFASAQPERKTEFMKLTVRDSNGKPYYSIIYLEFDDNGVGHDFEGYSSYSLDVISDYLKKYFMPSAQPEQIWLPLTESDIDHMFDYYAKENNENLTDRAQELKEAMWVGYMAAMKAQPEIIQCKDCKHWMDIDDGRQKHRMCADLLGDWFCADAERREE